MGLRLALSRLIAALAPVRSVALFAMMVQVLFYADHIGASAVRSFGTLAPGDRLGVLEICTGEGVVLVSADGAPIEMPPDCPICDNASMAAFGEPAAMPAPVQPVVALVEVRSLPCALPVASQRFPSDQPIRAPPFAAA